MSLTYVIERLPQTSTRGDNWSVYAHHDNGDATYIAHHKARSAAIVATRLLAGWRNKVVLRDNRERVTAFKVPA